MNSRRRTVPGQELESDRVPDDGVYLSRAESEQIVRPDSDQEVFRERARSCDESDSSNDKRDKAHFRV